MVAAAACQLSLAMLACSTRGDRELLQLGYLRAAGCSMAGYAGYVASQLSESTERGVRNSAVSISSNSDPAASLGSSADKS
jgi:hypothetical protein